MSFELSARIAVVAVVLLAISGTASAQNGPVTALGDGQNLVYVFTGVTNDTTAEDETATVVHCTNLGLADVDVTVELYLSNGDFGASNTQTLNPGETETWESQQVPSVSQAINIALADDIFAGGSGRILASDKKSQLLCTAQSIDMEATAVHLANLPMFRVAKGLKVKPFKE